MSYNFYTSPQISSKFCVYAGYILGYSILWKLLLQKHTGRCLWKGEPDSINLTIKVQYWSCSDAQHNWKNRLQSWKSSWNLMAIIFHNTLVIWDGVYISPQFYYYYYWWSQSEAVDIVAICNLLALARTSWAKAKCLLCNDSPVRITLG